jgi:DNA N-6-adenine-methyltransferase (Dam)
MNVTFETGGDGSIATTHDWLTPLWVLRPLGDFDIDPCASQTQPWKTAETQFTIKDDGLSRDWHGRVWCNPPYGDKAEKFLKRMSEHGDGIVLIFARTETKAFQKYCFGRADGMLFLDKRVQFCLPDGTLPKKGGGRSAKRADCLRPKQCSSLERFKAGGLHRGFEKQARRVNERLV